MHVCLCVCVDCWAGAEDTAGGSVHHQAAAEGGGERSQGDAGQGRGGEVTSARSRRHLDNTPSLIDADVDKRG